MDDIQGPIGDIVFVAGRLQYAMVDIREQFEIVRMIDSRRGILCRDGRQERFVIVQHDQQAYGLRVREYHWLPSSHGIGWQERARLRDILDACMAMQPPTARRLD